MENQKKEQNEKDMDVTRSQNPQKQEAAGTPGEENRPEGGKNKGTGLDPERSTKEGAYDKQSDDPGMHPGVVDEGDKS